jgi:hypothetical protein
LNVNKKKLAETKAEVVALLGRLPGQSPDTWLAREIESAKGAPNRDAETLEMLCAALERLGKKTPKIPSTRRPAMR